MTAEPSGAFEVRWVRVVALAAFVAGLAIGLAAPVVVAAVRGEEDAAVVADPDEVYVRQLAEQYELSETQERSLRMVLLDAKNASARILRQIIQGDPEKLPPELLTVRNRADERIQVLLTEAQRERFNRDKR